MSRSGVMCIVACLMMEDELVHIVSKDQEVTSVSVVQNEECSGLMEKLRSIDLGIEVRAISLEDVRSKEGDDGVSLVILMKDMGLHESPEKLKKDMLETMGTLKGSFDVILLLYGLCGNALKDVKSLSKEAKAPVFILRDGRGEVVDDCIAAVVGGREAYQGIVKRDLGVYFLTPMWASNWREMAVKTRVVPDGNNDDLMRIILEGSGYKKVIKIETGLGDQEEFEERVNEFSRIFNLKKEVVEGDLSIVERSYERAKEELAG